ncbi:hypothetical protein [Amycolatopsis methanolica]|uniref:PknH-like extracellular domain-containing protein n=1 Tax=Amycolatopsis methanolica 239 TaxID=1068978 RepID=A0A076MSM5_AMYME|nr:hypothetical protein [Amycolatopsis methanolica]AIJ23634.1 hypothetical protein AMETH_3542 [Amycolatopsis methanolica 239]
MVVLAAVVLTGLTGCADRPNDLETYYDKPADATTPVTTPSASPSVSVGQAAELTPVNHIAEDVAAAVLTKSDLSGEGVREAAARAANGSCFDAVPAGDPRGSTWLYNSGSSLTQQVTGYLDRTAAEVLAQVDCDGTALTVTRPAGAEAARAWCDGTTCTLLLAGGHVLSGLQVTASTQNRAAEAVKGLASVAAGKLPRS